MGCHASSLPTTTYISWKILLRGGSGRSRWGGHTKAPPSESFVLNVGDFTGAGHDQVDTGVIDLPGKQGTTEELKQRVVESLLAAEIELVSERRAFGGSQVYFRCPGQACGRGP